MKALPTILLVDDNEDDYEATVRSFEKNNFMNSIVWCNSGRKALDYLRREGEYVNDNSVKSPELILLDLNMPGIDGRQVLKEIKKDTYLRKIPIVVLTTSSDERDVEACYDLGASTYIQKPVSFEALTRAIGTMQDYWFGFALLPKYRGDE